MKNFLRFLSIAVFAALFCAAPAAKAQLVFGSPNVNPGAAGQFVYIDTNGHSVPFALVEPKSGVVYVVFDPSTSLTDRNNVASYVQGDWGRINAQSAFLQTQVIAHVVNLNINTQLLRQAGDFSIQNSSTLTTVPGLQGVVQTAGHYTFRAILFVSAGGSGGIKIDFGGTASTANVIAETLMYGANALTISNQQTSFLSGPTGSTSAIQMVVIEGEFDVGNGGTFVIQAAQNAPNSTATLIKSGSNLVITQTP